MAPGVQDHNVRYTDPTMQVLWKDMADGFYNYGMISPKQDIEKVSDLTQANVDFINYIIEKMGIDENSRVLDCGTGPGAYMVEIAKKTGCKYTATDINKDYLTAAKERAQEAGVLGQGRYLYSSWENMNPAVKDTKYTHILSLMTLYYGHPVLETIFKDLADVCTPDTKIMAQDFIRRGTWEACAKGKFHFKIPHPLANLPEIFGALNTSPLCLVDYEDFTPWIIPGYKVMKRECLKRDPELKTLTYPLLGQDIMDGNIGLVIFYFKLRPQ